MFSIKHFVFVLFIIAALSPVTSVLAQRGELPGQIISEEQANLLFGNVVFSQTFNKKMLMALTKNVNDVLLFNIIDGELVVLDGKRKPVFPRNFLVTPDMEFHMYDVRKLNELLNLTGAKTINVEVRQRGVLTITTRDGNFGGSQNGKESTGWTLEFATMCPPWCLE